MTSAATADRYSSRDDCSRQRSFFTGRAQRNHVARFGHATQTWLTTICTADAVSIKHAARAPLSDAKSRQLYRSYHCHRCYRLRQP
jgi:hypothetical protein